MVEEVYRRADDYDLEQSGESIADVPFWCALVRRYGARRVLELACGTGRVTLELARAGAVEGYRVVGLELAPEMLALARRKLAAESAEVQAAARLLRGDMRTLQAALSGEEPFDLIVVPNGSVSHLVTLDDQLATWRGARALLRPGGRFVVDLLPPNLAELAAAGPAAPLAFDLEVDAPDGQTRLLRLKSTRYQPHEQLAQVRYIYEKYRGGDLAQRYLSSWPMHVYFPRELQLLFLHTGYTMEALYGSYTGDSFGPDSAVIIAIGQRPQAGPV